MKATDAVALILAENEVSHGFELIGGMITHLVDSINQLGKTKLISVHHEQAAAFAAAGIARASNHKKIGVALGTSGPGATNLITGIADCWLDSHPCVFLTGQVNTNELKGDLPIRQQGFQELDSVSLVSSITKYAKQILNVNELAFELQKAINIAREGRPGPVLLDIPMDIQRADILDELVSKALSNKIQNIDESKDLDSTTDFSKIFLEIENSKNPLFLIGGGAVNSPYFKSFLDELIGGANIPYVSSLKGSEKTINSEFYLGMIGAYGNRVANLAIQNCDLLIVLASRLDVRQTGAEVNTFAPYAKIIQIDIDAGQINNRVQTEGVLANVDSFFRSFLSSKITSSYDEWNEKLLSARHSLNKDEYNDLSLSPYKIFNVINTVFSGLNVHYVADVGNNQMWAAHNLKLDHGQACHHSAGLGAMGFAVPAAIGVNYVTDRPTVVITGDGGVQLNIQELDIISRENLPILVLIFNNYSLGMVRGFQELYFSGRNSSTYWQGYSCDFVQIGEGYGLQSVRVDSLEEFEKELQYFRMNKKPTIIEIVMPDVRECRPRLEYGNPLDMQSPKLDFKLDAL